MFVRNGRDQTICKELAITSNDFNSALILCRFLRHIEDHFQISPDIASERATSERWSDRASEREIERASERAIKRASDRASERSSDRKIERDYLTDLFVFVQISSPSPCDPTANQNQDNLVNHLMNKSYWHLTTFTTRRWTHINRVPY